MKSIGQRIRLYGIAVLLVVAAAALKVLSQPFLGEDRPFLLFFPAIALSAWYGGMRTGLVTTLVSALVVDYFFIPPDGFGTFIGFRHNQELDFTLFLIEGLIIGGLFESLQRNRQQFKLLMESVEDYAIFTISPDGRITSWNNGAQRIKGYDKREIIGKPYSLFFSSEDVERGEPERILKQAAQEGKVEIEGWRVRKDGTRFLINAVITPLYDDGGQLRGFAKVTRDVTERRHSQVALEESEARMAGIINSAMDAIISVDDQQKVTLFNQAAEKIFGYEAQQVLGKPLDMLLPERFRAAHARHIVHFGQTGVTRRSMRSPGQLVGLRSDGVEFPIEASISQLTIKDEKTYTVIIRDVTERVRAEAALLKSEQNAQRHLAELEATYNTAPVGLCVLDVDLCFVRVNERLAEMNGVSVQDHLGHTVREVAPDVANQLEPLLENVLKTGEPVLNLDVVGETKAQPGVRRAWIENWFPLKDKTGKVIAINITAEEVTERKRMENQLVEQTERYRTLFNSIDEGFVLIQMLFDEAQNPVDYCYLDVNPQFEKQTGLSASELMAGKTIRQVLPTLEEKWFQIYGRVALTGQSVRFVEGSEVLGRWFDVYALRIGKPEEHTVAILFRDITERKQQEEAQRRRAEFDAYRVKLNDMMRSLSDPIEIQVQASRILGQHLHASRVHYGETNGDDHHLVIHRDYCNGVRSITGTILLDNYGPVLLKEFRAGRTVVVNDVSADERFTPEERAAAIALELMSYVAVPLVKEGRFAANLAVHHLEPHQWTADEIALIEETAERTWAAVERARAETVVRRSEARYRTLVENFPNGVVLLFDHDLRYVVVGGRGLETLNLSSEQMTGKTIFEVFPEDFSTNMAERYRAIFKGDVFIDEAVVNNRVFITYNIPIYDGQGNITHGMVMSQDITERKRDEAALKRYAERLQTLHEIDLAIIGAQSPEILAQTVMGYMRHLLRCDRAAISLYDFENREIKIVGLDSPFEGDYDPGMMIPMEQFGDLDFLRELTVHYIPDLDTSGTLPPALQHVRSLGLRSTLTLTLVIDGRLLGAINVASKQPDGFSEEDQHIGREIAAQLTIAFQQALLNEQIRLHAQELERRVEERTIQLTAVNKELEAFSYSVSHDLRAPLRVVDGFSHILLEDYADKLDEEGRYYLERMYHGTQRMSELIDDLLNLSRVTRQKLEITHFDFSELAQEVADALKNGQPERNVEFLIHPGIEATGDRGLLRIVLENLFGNAWKFTGKKEQGMIEFGKTETNGEWWYYVRDNGAGFNMEYAGKLFGAFQRLHTEAEFEGTGIGLATVQRIVNRHGGKIYAEGVEGEGSTFYFTAG